MFQTRSPAKRYALAAALGAVGGAVLVVVGSRSIPKIVSRLKPLVKQKMLQHMHT